MSLRKRLRVLWAAVTQEWHEEVCAGCGTRWWADLRCVPSGMDCMTCEYRHFDAWKQKYDAKQRITKGVA